MTDWQEVFSKVIFFLSIPLGVGSIAYFTFCLLRLFLKDDGKGENV